MKKRFLAILLTVLLAAALAVPAAAAGWTSDQWDTSLRRVNDFIDVLTDEEADALNEKACDAIDPHEFDFVVVLCSADDYEGDELLDYATTLYENNGLGYGDTKDGVILLVDMDNYEYVLTGFGRGYYVFGDDAVFDKVSGDFVDTFNENGSIAEAIDAFLDSAAEAVEGFDPDEATREQMENWLEAEPFPEAGPESVQLPGWYPEDVSTFSDFHNSGAARVVDGADIFSAADEAAMAEKIETIREKYDTDLVVYTDVSSYGMPRNLCAADFYQFNGYGLGSDYSGTCLFICMEAGNRGFETVWRGACSRYYTNDITDKLDDRLYDRLSEGEYGKGVLEYLDNIDFLYAKGKLPRTRGTTVLIVGAAVLLGLITSGINLGVMKSKMKTVREATEAHDYLVPGSFKLRRQNDYYLYSTVTRTQKPKNDERSGGGGSSHSSFSSSGGGSFGSSGRSF